MSTYRDHRKSGRPNASHLRHNTTMSCFAHGLGVAFGNDRQSVMDTSRSGFTAGTQRVAFRQWNQHDPIASGRSREGSIEVGPALDEPVPTVGLDSGPLLLRALRPCNLNLVTGLRPAQAKVQGQVALQAIASPSQHGLHLDCALHRDRNPRSYGTAVRLHSSESDHHHVPSGCRILQKCRSSVDIHLDNFRHPHRSPRRSR